MNRPGCLYLYCQTKVHHPPPRSTDWSHSHGPSSKIMTAWGSCPAAHRCSWRDISRIIKPAPVACRGGSPTRPGGLKAIFTSQHSLSRSLLDKSHPRPLGLPFLTSFIPADHTQLLPIPSTCLHHTHHILNAISYRSASMSMCLIFDIIMLFLGAHLNIKDDGTVPQKEALDLESEVSRVTTGSPTF